MTAPLDAAALAAVRALADKYFTPVDLGNGASELPHLGFDAANTLADAVPALLATLDARDAEIARLRDRVAELEANCWYAELDDHEAQS